MDDFERRVDIHTFSYQLVFLLAVGAACASGKLLLGASKILTGRP